MNFDLIHIVTVIFGISVFLKLIFELIDELRKRIFPAYLNYFIAFSLLTYALWGSSKSDFIYFSGIYFLLILWFLCDYLILRKVKSKLQVVDYRIVSRWNLLYFTFTLGLLVFYYLFIQITGKEFLFNKVVLILLIGNPSLNRIIFSIIKNRQNLPANAFILPQIRTFIFSSDKIISKNKYKLISFKNHSQLSKDIILQMAYLLTDNWNKSLADALLNKLSDISQEKTFQTIKKSSNGIRAKDNKGEEYIFGDYSLVKSLVSNNDATHYLIKNDILIAKFTFRELFNFEGIRLSKQFNEYGNVVLLSDKPVSQEHTKLPFDKIYFNLTNDRQKELIENLTRKANTALITFNKNLCKIASFDFFIDKIENLQNVFEEFLRIKKVFSRLNSALILFFAIETVFAIVALFIFNQVFYVLAVNLSVSGLFIFFLKLFLKKVD